MTEQEKRQRRVCFTGHRPEKLTRSEEEIRQELDRCIRQAAALGKTVFITGMARGTDIWAAQTVLTLRAEGEPVRLLCACPYAGFDAYFDSDWQRQSRAVLAAADDVRVLSPLYHTGCFAVRNRWMVDHASAVIAVYSGQAGGTAQTLRYAERMGLPVTVIGG